MSSRSTGFVRDSRFGEGQVIKGTDREVSRKWHALGFNFTGSLLHPATCGCGRTFCDCDDCHRLMGGKCAGCAGVPGLKV